jgi:flavin reductase (DIM6/NTAB) family NADH-FMN oxidoreductase RutF
MRWYAEGSCNPRIPGMASLADLKIDVPESGYDKLASPVGTLVMITTVDKQGRVNAASFATCFRNNHVPCCYEFSVDAYKDTAANVLATGEFVVNIPPFDREVLEKVCIVGLPFAPGVNELEKAGLTAVPSKVVKPPRIGECRSHFECKVEWTKQWLETRVTVVGRVVAASVNRDCLDQDGFVIHDKLKPAHYCGHAYMRNGASRFVAAYEVMEVQQTYKGPEAKMVTGVGEPPPKRS